MNLPTSSRIPPNITINSQPIRPFIQHHPLPYLTLIPLLKQVDILKHKIYHLQTTNNHNLHAITNKIPQPPKQMEELKMESTS